MTQSQIPIRNIYYMLAYAGNHFQNAKMVNLGAVSFNYLVDLLGHVLNKSILQLSRRGLELGYQSRTDLVSGIKGRLNITQTIRGFHLNHAKTVSIYDEMTSNTLANQIIKSTLTILINQQKLDKHVREEAHSIHSNMSDISEPRLTSLHFAQVRAGNNNRDYKFIISICKLIKENSILNKDSGQYRFYDFERNERHMSLLYQNFLYKFCQRELKGIDASRPHLKWDASSESDNSLSLLPRMETDITLKKNSNIVIVDAKYYKNTFQERHETEKFHSSNLYQLMSYLWSMRVINGEKVSGLLLYPHVKQVVRHSYKINNFDINLCTINLNNEWDDIHHDLTDIFEEIMK